MAEPILAASAELLVRSTVLMAIAWAAAAGLRRAGAPASARHLVWALGLLGLLLLPLLSAALPTIQLPILPLSGETAVGAASVLDPATDSVAFAWQAAAILYALVTYALVTGLLLCRVLLGQLALRCLWQAAAPAPDRWAKQVAAMTCTIGMERAVELRFAPDRTMPMTWGTLRPKILLPADAHCWSAERSRMVLAHELAHVARRDSLIQTLGSLAAALYWGNPLAWYLLAQLRTEQEHACDDLVLATGVQPHCYARGLLDVVYSRAAPRFAASVTVGIGGPSQLERRLIAIIGSGSRHVFGRRFAAASFSAAILLNMLVAVVVPVGAVSDAVPGALQPVAELARTAAAGPLHRASAEAHALPLVEGRHIGMVAQQTARRLPRAQPGVVQSSTPVTPMPKRTVAVLDGSTAPTTPPAVRAIPALSPIPPMPPLPVRPAVLPKLPAPLVAPEPPRPSEIARPPP
jgi:beta-lactamase regulating signal transducer with metallopeptidase domain